MSDASNADRTEKPTPRRLDKAREEGSVVRAHSLAGAAVLLAGAGIFALAGTKLVTLLELSLRSGLCLDPAHMRDPEQLFAAAMAVAQPAVTILAPFLLLMAVIAFVADLAIGGWILSGRPLAPDFSRIDPIKGIGRLFSHEALAEIVKALVKFVLVGGLAGWLLYGRIGQFASIAAATWPAAVREFASLSADLFLILAGALAAVTALEVPYQYWSHRSRLRMTRQDLKDEMREVDGNPHTRRRVRNLRIRMARARMMAAVPKADVVVTNPEHYAAALSYEDGRMGAPKLVAKGSGLVALRIRELAREHGVAIVEAPPLARAICRFVELGDEIPTGLYGAVAEVLAYVYRLRAARDTGQAPAELPRDGRFDPPPEFRA